MFIDYAKIYVRGGKGGSGCVSFHRQKFVDKGGPDGGDGGNGGSVIINANKNLRTLQDFTYRKEYRAKRGQHGMGSNKHGKYGQDIVLQAPVGTVVKDAESGEVLTDLTENKQSFILARGGKGGRGNARFTSSVHRSPREWEVGEDGQERWIELELKVIADIGLVGLPNAGKSTLLSTITAAKPKIANYPFTTLQPNLGIVPYREYKNFVVADIPGLIEGAHEGKGLGHRFLRHIERTRAIAYLIDITDPHPQETFDTLYDELRKYSTILVQKPAVIIMTKVDILRPGEDDLPRIQSDLQQMPVSAVSGYNVSALKDQFFNMIERSRTLEQEF
ncbi:MAG: GTPase ObgE [Caldithrix sp.]|nr:GTPase ObgE [Caldithrix sp.]